MKRDHPRADSINSGNGAINYRCPLKRLRSGSTYQEICNSGKRIGFGH
jgi:hypothetical protein